MVSPQSTDERKDQEPDILGGIFQYSQRVFMIQYYAPFRLICAASFIISSASSRARKSSLSCPPNMKNTTKLKPLTFEKGLLIIVMYCIDEYLTDWYIFIKTPLVLIISVSVRVYFTVLKNSGK